MKFALVKLSGFHTHNHSYVYRSTIMEMGASAKYTNPFESEAKMISIMNSILARQKSHGDVRSVLDKIREGGFYFFDLDLTREEAECLGWKNSLRP